MGRRTSHHPSGGYPRASGIHRYRHYFQPYMTKNEQLIWVGRSSARSTLLAFAPIWWASVPAMVLFWFALPHDGVALMPFLAALGLTLGPIGSAAIARRTFFAVTQRRALFLVHMSRWNRSFTWLEFHGAVPRVRAEPAGAATVFIGFVGKPTRHKFFTDGYGNMGFWRIRDAAAVAELIGGLASSAH